VLGEVPGSGIPDAVYMIDTETGRVWILQGNLKEVRFVEIERGQPYTRTMFCVVAAVKEARLCSSRT